MKPPRIVLAAGLLVLIVALAAAVDRTASAAEDASALAEYIKGLE